MMNAAAPMMGGMICPPVDATASTPGGYEDLYEEVSKAMLTAIETK